jgi:hypothetical protein
MKLKFKFIASLALILPFLFMASSCEEILADLDDEDTEQIYENLGWIGIDKEDTESIEDAISFGSGDLPSKADISGNMPPVGNQGQYGTCVAWAVGYGHKTYMEAVENNRTTADLSNTAYQFSPKYLFWAIPSGSKGVDCGGTGFQPAYDVMLNKGIAQESVVPYTDLGDCSGSTSSWDNDASYYKIENYREIDVNISTIKQYLAQGRAVVFGAKLGDNFMGWNSSEILYSDTYGYSGQHAYHAMILTGYDDSKGTNGAFRVLNSWGTGWGDNGYIWVDQNFFVGNGGDFAFCAFAAKNKPTTDPDPDDDNNADDLADGMDVMAWELNDYDNGGGKERVAKYNVFNSGNQEVKASEDWNILYLYYNAYDAEDYGILLYDYYSDDYGSLGQDGELTSGGDGIGNWWNYINVPAGQSVAQALYGGSDARFSWPYTMPDITGEYYLVIIADGYDVLTEVDEENNYFYLTDTNGEPIQITNGVIQDQLMDNSKSGVVPPKKFGPSERPTVRTQKNLNAYTPDEITAMIKNRKETGEIQRKAMQYVNKNSFPKKVERR